MFNLFKKKEKIEIKTCNLCKVEGEVIQNASVLITYTSGKEMYVCKKHFNELMNIIKKEPKRLESMETFTIL